VLADGLFDRQLVHPNWPQDQLDRWYTAQVSPININDNCIDIRVEGTVHGRPVRILSIKPGGPELVRENNCTTGGKKPGVWVIRDPETNELELRGLCPKGRQSTAIITIRDPAKLVGDLFRRQLIRAGVNVTGSVRLDHRPLAFGNFNFAPDQRIIATESHRLDEVVKRMNKYSQNMFAECLLKLLGAAYASKMGAIETPTGTWKKGQKAVTQFMRSLKIPDSQFVIDDGSGLSRENRLSAFSLAYVLLWMSRQPKGVGTTFMDSLAVMGEDGTLSRRMRGTSCQGRVRGKSGYLSRVSALSGYVDSLDGGRLAFSILVNDVPPGNVWKAKKMQDSICDILVRHTSIPSAP
jgi:D-alanyl-D-alanine carboxypeptidase/D-alanyl-D-alanine-endopeptidase (penicillin-binding protein 4)